MIKKEIVIPKLLDGFQKGEERNSLFSALDDAPKYSRDDAHRKFIEALDLEFLQKNHGKRVAIHRKNGIVVMEDTLDRTYLKVKELGLSDDDIVFDVIIGFAPV